MILIIDNYDSFTYNVAQALGGLGREVVVKRNDAITVDQAQELAPEAVVISPGPGRPEQAGVSCAVIERLAGKVPILGICLGHQAIGHVFGGQVGLAQRPVHGKTWDVYHDGKGLFQGLRNPFCATRYHSLIVEEKGLDGPLKVSAFTQEGEVMGLSCREMALEGVQFHPESIATSQGGLMFENFLAAYLGAPRNAGSEEMRQ